MAIKVHPPLLDREIVTLFANTLKAPNYEHIMSSSTQQFIDVIVMAKHIEYGIRSGMIFAPIEKKGLRGKRKMLIVLRVSIKAKGIISKFQQSYRLHPK